MRVLLVDDEEALLRSLQRTMRLHGIESVSATSVPLAVNLMDSVSIDVVLTDYNLGGANGHDVEALANARGLPTIILTGNPSVQGDNVLRKPCDSDVLVAALWAAVKKG